MEEAIRSALVYKGGAVDSVFSVGIAIIIFIYTVLYLIGFIGDLLRDGKVCHKWTVFVLLLLLTGLFFTFRHVAIEDKSNEVISKEIEKDPEIGKILGEAAYIDIVNNEWLNKHPDWKDIRRELICKSIREELDKRTKERLLREARRRKEYILRKRKETEVKST